MRARHLGLDDARTVASNHGSDSLAGTPELPGQSFRNLQCQRLPDGSLRGRACVDTAGRAPRWITARSRVALVVTRAQPFSPRHAGFNSMRAESARGRGQSGRAPRGRKREFDARARSGIAATPPLKSSVRQSRSPILWILAGLGLCSLHLLAPLDIYDTFGRILSCILLLLTLYVSQRTWLTPGRAPIVWLVVSQFYLAYALAQFFQDHIRVDQRIYVPATDAVTKAMLLALGAAACFVLGSRLGESQRHLPLADVWSLAPKPSRHWTLPAAAWGIAGAAIQIGATGRPDLVPLEFRNLSYLILNPGLLLLVVLRAYHQSHTRAAGIGAFLITILMCVSGVMSSMLERLVVPLVGLTLASWIWGRGVQLRWLLVAAALYITLTPTKHAYRELANREQPDGPVASAMAKSFATWAEAIEARRPEGSDALVLGMNRTSYLLQLAQGVEWIPSELPYNYGRGFETAVLFAVPRFVWPEKPGYSELINNRYAVALGVTTDKGVETSSFGLLQPLDGYWDFGVFGAVLYPFVYGILVGALFLAASRAPEQRDLIAGAVCLQLFQALAALQNVLASFLTVLPGFAASLWLVDLSSRLVAKQRARSHRPVCPYRPPLER